MRSGIAQVGVGIGLLLGMAGQVITFVPGGAASWFWVSAAAAAFGMLSPR